MAFVLGVKKEVLGKAHLIRSLSPLRGGKYGSLRLTSSDQCLIHSGRNRSHRAGGVRTECAGGGVRLHTRQSSWLPGKRFSSRLSNVHRSGDWSGVPSDQVEARAGVFGQYRPVVSARLTIFSCDQARLETTGTIARGPEAL